MCKGKCHEGKSPKELPDFYETVAKEILCKCHPREGVWVDLGTGAGGVGLALASQSIISTIVLIDPNADALQEALRSARRTGLGERIVAIKAQAEFIPLSDNCIDLAVSRGSIFFWNNKVQGLREVYRILRPGGAAMIGGGLGESYPQWARQEFIQRRHKEMKRRGPDAFRRFREARSSRTFRRQAEKAGLVNFEITGDGAANPDSLASLGIWLRFRKEKTGEA